VRRLLRSGLGYLLAVACLAWVFHGTRTSEFGRHTASIDWAWVAPAILFDILGYVCQGARWALLLRPLGKISVLRTTQAIYIGLFASEIMPMRLGELVRALLISAYTSAPMSAVLSSVFVERLLEGLWVGIGVGLTAIFFPLPRKLVAAASVLGFVLLAAVSLFLWILLQREPRPRRGTDLTRRRLPRVRAFVAHLADGVREIGWSYRLSAALALTFLFLVLQALAFWLIMLACRLPLPFWTGIAVYLIVRLGTAIPNAPANVGTYQFFSVLGLTLFGVEKTQATVFSVVVFVILTFPLWLIGLLALSHSGATLRSLQRGISERVTRTERTAEPGGAAKAAARAEQTADHILCMIFAIQILLVRPL
jgi:glycosyltransferase 2 family protein